MSRAKKKLRLARETVRLLACDQLARVGGGFIDPTLEHSEPKTNAWGASAEGEDGDRACGAWGA